MEIISFLAQEDSLAAIQLKQTALKKLVFENSAQIMLVKYGNMALVVVLPLMIAFWRITRRRGLRRFSYDSRH